MGYHFDIEHLLTEDEGKNTLPAISLGVYIVGRGMEKEEAIKRKEFMSAFIGEELFRGL